LTLATSKPFSFSFLLSKNSFWLFLSVIGGSELAQLVIKENPSQFELSGFQMKIKHASPPIWKKKLFVCSQRKPNELRDSIYQVSTNEIPIPSQ
jgi:hypothetical protein